MKPRYLMIDPGNTVTDQMQKAADKIYRTGFFKGYKSGVLATIELMEAGVPIDKIKESVKFIEDVYDSEAVERNKASEE